MAAYRLLRVSFKLERVDLPDRAHDRLSGHVLLVGRRRRQSAYYDIARTLGASRCFLFFKVAIPAALPQVFVGLFMDLDASFAVLVTAEMMGVKAGLGFYLQWAQGWAAYANMYAALIVMSLMCTSLVTLLFKLRDRVLSYQKGDLKW